MIVMALSVQTAFSGCKTSIIHLFLQISTLSYLYAQYFAIEKLSRVKFFRECEENF
jgi:hypothetical protein